MTAPRTTGADPMDLHQIAPVDAGMLRTVCGLFVTGVTVITSGVADQATGTTVNSFTSVSLDPPLVLFCLHRESRLRRTVEESRAYAVNFLAGRQEGLALAFAGRDTAVIRDVARRRAAMTEVPVLSEALAFLSCRLVEVFEGGDHVILLGEVIELGMTRRQREPLIFYRGSLGELQEEPRAAYPIWDG